MQVRSFLFFPKMVTTRSQSKLESTTQSTTLKEFQAAKPKTQSQAVGVEQCDLCDSLYIAYRVHGHSVYCTHCWTKKWSLIIKNGCCRICNCDIFTGQLRR